MLVDTAGMRRQSKVAESVEYYTTLRSQRAVERADVALVVCDAHRRRHEPGPAHRRAGHAGGLRDGARPQQVGRRASMDEADLDHERARVAAKLRLRPKVLTASALTGRHVDRILTEAIALGDRMRNRIPTPELNRFLSEVVAARQPPAKQGHRLKLHLHGADRDAAAALRDPGQLAAPGSRATTPTSSRTGCARATRMDGVPLIIDFNERGPAPQRAHVGTTAEVRPLSVAVRPFRAEDEPAVVRLLTSAFTGWPRQLPGADPAAAFRWKHLESPFGPSVMVVAEDDGAIVGFEALLRWPFTSSAGMLETLRGVDLAVAGSHRGRGVAGELIRVAAERARGSVPLVFSNPNAASDRLLVKHGRHPVGPFEVLVRPRRPLRLVRARVAGGSPRPPRGAAGEPAARLLGDDEAVAGLLARRPATAARFATALTPGYLDWRYGRVGDYRAVGVRRDGRLDGLGIFRVVPRGGAWALALCEMLAAGDDPEIVRALLRAALAAAPADYAVCHFPRGSAAARAAGRTGFVRLRRGQRVLVNPLRDGLEPDPTRTESWALTYGDVELL